MSKEGRPSKFSGTVFPRKESAFWWIRYRNREARIVRESTGTTDRQEAERFLRERLDARDEGKLPIMLSGKNLTFGEWGGVADHFVTQMLRQVDSQIFKRYSQAKLNMMRDALTRLDRQANEDERISSTASVN